MRGRSERDTCRDFVEPRLEAAGWTKDQIVSQYVIRADRTVQSGERVRVLEGGRADYVLEIVPGLPVAVVEAKPEYAEPPDGLQQGIEYAETLDVPTAISTNGHELCERDLHTGREADVGGFPSPAEAWSRYVDFHGLTDEATQLLRQPFDRSLRNADQSVQQPRYYQVIAVHRVLRAISAGERRILLLMATGSGKTFTALQLVAKLLGYWKMIDPDRPRRVLYLADRDALIEEPYKDYFLPVFQDGAARIQGRTVMGREAYFATYQALDQGGDAETLFSRYPSDFFDLVIVDECHRGSAPEGSSWRAILRHFASAVQVGLTATPKRDANVDTYAYFGDPVFEYSLRDGIEDGYLAPYRVRRTVLNVDAEGWRPDPGELDRFGREVPDDLYITRDFERVVSLLTRTRQVARHLTGLLRRDPGARMAVFCVDSEHAEQMRRALVDQNPDLVRAHPDWVVRIVSAEGETGRRMLARFCDPEGGSPVVATTSRMLSTGIDIEDLKYVVLFRPIGSMVEFKQIIGRGSRLYPDKGKYSFEIVDYVGATRLFADPGFDGPPVAVVDDPIGDDVQSHTDEADTSEPDEDSDVGEAQVNEPSPPFNAGGESDDGSDIPPSALKYYVEGHEVTVTAEGFYVADTSTGNLRLVEYTDYVGDQVRALYPAGPDELRHRWATGPTRAEIEQELAGRGISVEELAERAGLVDTDPFDVLVHLAWNVPARTRAERARLARTDHADDLERQVPDARRVIEALLETYGSRGVDEMAHPYAVEVPPLSNLGSPTEIAQLFGGADGWHRVVDEIQRWLYSA